MYDLVEEKIKTGSGILHLVMVCFLFVVTFMLNIMFGNKTFDDDKPYPFMF